MKLFKAFTIFYPRRYRIVLGGLLVVFFLANTLVPFVFGTNPQMLISTLFIIMMSIVMLYGDLEVFAGIYNKEGGQIASCQSSYYGERTIATGILADRIGSFLWIFVIGLVQFLWGESIWQQTVWSMLTGCALVFSIVTIGVNINRFMVTSQGVMFASMIEGSISSACAYLFFGVFPIGTWWSAALAFVLAVVLTAVTVLIASHFLKRSYCDV